MKIKLILTGKTDESYLKTGIEEYERRIKRYIPFETITIPGIKASQTLSHKEIKLKEAEKIQQYLSVQDFIVVLDEKGKEMSSVDFSAFLSQKFNSSIKTVVFIVGGPFGADEELKRRANLIISLSQMTFSHQMVRLFFTEQLYRALTILANESYHH
jgi:23S rRNA (pseudouridine1915-N3)-methyltransferase